MEYLESFILPSEDRLVYPYRQMYDKGLEKIDFGWYFKHISLLALLGYLAGALCFWLMHTAFA